MWAKTRAVCDGLKLLKDGLKLDSLQLVTMRHSSSSVAWSLIYIFIEIKILLPQHTFISHIYREGNQGVDFMTNWGINNTASNLFEDPRLLPKKLDGILQLERSGLPYVRMK